jgi:anti-anti-sigma factor
VAQVAIEVNGNCVVPDKGASGIAMAELDEGGDGADQLGVVRAGHDPSGVLVVSLRGEIDISNADAIGTELERVLDGANGRFVLDLADLGFMDSSGIAMLLRTVARTGPVAVRNPTATVRRMIEATGLSGVLPIEE